MPKHGNFQKLDPLTLMTSQNVIGLSADDQQRVLNTFPSPGSLRSEDGVV